ncbi:serine/threonine-protein kinase [Kitasatospora sp. NPDC001660]
MEPLEPDDPRQVGEYRVLRRLGAGGMGRVYLGRTAGGRTVAVKVVRGELAEDAEFRARFRQEVQAARLVGGRWTAPVLDADTEGRHPWVATGYVAGPALGAAVREFGPLPGDSVRALGVGLAEALAAVHALGLVHRDVKPSNVLLTLGGPRLIDFGIARALDVSVALTRSGFVIGSPGFMSPEQAQGAAVGPPSDVFSLGAVLAYAATGVAPFGEGLSVAALLYKVAHEEPELGDLDPALRAIVTACLAKDPAQRLTPPALAEQLDAGGNGRARLSGGDWLPGPLSAAVGRRAEELLDLDHEPEHSAGAGTPDPFHATAAPPATPRLPPTAVTLPYGGPPAEPVWTPQGWTSGTQAGAYGYPPHPGASSDPGSGRMYGPVPPVPPRRTGRRVALVAVVAAVSVAATVGLMQWLGEDRSGSGTAVAASTPPASRAVQQPVAQPSSGGQPATGDVPSSGSVPAAVLGKWKGTANTAFGTPASVGVIIVQGNVGETVEHSVVSYPNTSISCTGQGILVSVSSREIVVRESNASTDAMCAGSRPVQVTYRLNTSGTLQATIGTGTAELTRQG